MVQQIALTQGKFALVDDEDYERLNAHKWTAHRIGRNWYVVRSQRIAGRDIRFYMHRVVMQLENKSLVIDHVDRDGFNNQKSNLRVATRGENNRNRVVRKDSKSGYKGVGLLKNGRYYARIRVDGTYFHLGCFHEPEDAARAYDEAARKYHGEFASTNF